MFFIILYYLLWFFLVLVRIFHHAMCIPAPVPVVSEPVTGVCARGVCTCDWCLCPCVHVSCPCNPWLIPTGAICTGPSLAQQSERGRDSPALACPDAKLRFGENNIFLALIRLYYTSLFFIILHYLIWFFSGFSENIPPCHVHSRPRARGV